MGVLLGDGRAGPAWAVGKCNTTNKTNGVLQGPESKARRSAPAQAHERSPQPPSLTHMEFSASRGESTTNEQALAAGAPLPRGAPLAGNDAGAMARQPRHMITPSWREAQPLPALRPSSLQPQRAWRGVAGKDLRWLRRRRPALAQHRVSGLQCMRARPALMLWRLKSQAGRWRPSARFAGSGRRGGCRAPLPASPLRRWRAGFPHLSALPSKNRCSDYKGW